MDRVKCRMGVDSFMPSDFGFRRDLFLSQCGFCCLRQAIYHWLLCCQEVAKQYKGGRSWKGKDKMVCVLCRGICNPGGIIDCIPLRKTSDNWQRPVFSHILWCSFCACQLCPLLVGKGDTQAMVQNLGCHFGLQPRWSCFLLKRSEAESPAKRKERFHEISNRTHWTDP